MSVLARTTPRAAGADPVAHGYAVCEAITRREARNFSYGIRLLPPAQRRALSAVYALARRIDDIGDGDGSTAERTAALTAVRDQVHDLREGRSDADPVLVALRDAAARFPVPLDAFDDLLDGCQADVDGRRYETFDLLVGYCRRGAGSIGRLSAGIYHPADLDRAFPLADTLGVALQLTNILRDLREDRAGGRVYLPAQDLQRFGCHLALGPDGAISDPPAAFAALVRYEAARAQRRYDEGLALLALLDRRSAACTAAMAGIYRALLSRIAADPDLVRDRRLSLPGAAKARVAAGALLRRRT